MQAAGVLPPLELQALGAGRGALKRGRARWQGACPRQEWRTQGAGANGVDRLDLHPAGVTGTEEVQFSSGQFSSG